MVEARRRRLKLQPSQGGSGQMTNIVIDPFTRVEGHLRVELTVDDTTNLVTRAGAWELSTADLKTLS